MPTPYGLEFQIDGIGSYTVGDPLDRVTITLGSTDFMDVPQPSIMQAEFLVDSNDQTIAFWLGRKIIAKVKPIGGVFVSKFHGYVNSVNVESLTPDGSKALVSIAASSQMAQLQNVLVGATGYPAETETARAIKMQSEAMNISWAENPNGLSWSDLDPAITWGNFSAQYNRTLINYVGASSGFNLEAYSGGETDLLSFLQNWVTANGAFIYDSTSNEYTTICFYDNWVNAAASTLDITTCAIADSLTMSNDISNIYTSVTYANSTSSASYSNFNQLKQYGSRSVTVSSQCSSTTDLQTLATSRGVALSSPNVSLTGLTIDLDLLSAGDFVTLTRVANTFGQPNFWTFTGIPTMYGGNQTYAIAGLTMNLSSYHCEVDLILASDALRRGLTQWTEVALSNTWSNYKTATTTWASIN